MLDFNKIQNKYHRDHDFPDSDRFGFDKSDCHRLGRSELIGANDLEPGMI
jgi:hypothetical protein